MAILRTHETSEQSPFFKNMLCVIARLKFRFDDMKPGFYNSINVTNNMYIDQCDGDYLKNNNINYIGETFNETLINQKIQSAPN